MIKYNIPGNIITDIKDVINRYGKIQLVKDSEQGYLLRSDDEFLITEISDYVYEYSKKKYSNWELKLDYHFGGYAKITRELIQFIYSFKDLNNIQLDPIYTGKLMFAINDLVENYEFEDGSTIIGIHTGGLQGIAGMKNKVDKLLS